MKQLFILLLFFATGCRTSKVCRTDKNYSVLTYWKYGHKKILEPSAENKKSRGYFEYGTKLHYTKKSEILGVLDYYDTCHTMIKEVHLSHFKRKSVHLYYDQTGVKTKKKVYRYNKRNKVITWDKWGKRTVKFLEKGGRMY